MQTMYLGMDSALTDMPCISFNKQMIAQSKTVTNKKH